MRAVERRWSLLIGLALLLGSPSLVSAEAEPDTHVYRGEAQSGIYIAGELLLTVTDETAQALEQAIRQAKASGRFTTTGLPALDDALLPRYPLRAIEPDETPPADHPPRDSAEATNSPSAPSTASPASPHVYTLIFKDSTLDVQRVLEVLTHALRAEAALAPYILAAEPHYAVPAAAPAEGSPTPELPSTAEVPSSPLESPQPLVAPERSQAVSLTKQRLSLAAAAQIALQQPLSALRPTPSVSLVEAARRIALEPPQPPPRATPSVPVAEALAQTLPQPPPPPGTPEALEIFIKAQQAPSTEPDVTALQTTPALFNEIDPTQNPNVRTAIQVRRPPGFPTVHELTYDLATTGQGFTGEVFRFVNGDLSGLPELTLVDPVTGQPMHYGRALLFQVRSEVTTRFQFEVYDRQGHRADFRFTIPGTPSVPGQPLLWVDVPVPLNQILRRSPAFRLDQVDRAAVTFIVPGRPNAVLQPTGTLWLFGLGTDQPPPGTASALVVPVAGEPGALSPPVTVLQTLSPIPFQPLNSPAGIIQVRRRADVPAAMDVTYDLTLPEVDVVGVSFPLAPGPQRDFTQWPPVTFTDRSGRVRTEPAFVFAVLVPPGSTRVFQGELKDRLGNPAPFAIELPAAWVGQPVAVIVPLAQIRQARPGFALDDVREVALTFKRPDPRDLTLQPAVTTPRGTVSVYGVGTEQLPPGTFPVRVSRGLPTEPLTILTSDLPVAVGHQPGNPQRALTITPVVEGSGGIQLEAAYPEGFVAAQIPVDAAGRTLLAGPGPIRFSLENLGAEAVQVGLEVVERGPSGEARRLSSASLTPIRIPAGGTVTVAFDPTAPGLNWANIGHLALVFEPAPGFPTRARLLLRGLVDEPQVLLRGRPIPAVVSADNGGTPTLLPVTGARPLGEEMGLTFADARVARRAGTLPLQLSYDRRPNQPSAWFFPFGTTPQDLSRQPVDVFYAAGVAGPEGRVPFFTVKIALEGGAEHSFRVQLPQASDLQSGRIIWHTVTLPWSSIPDRSQVVGVTADFNDFNDPDATSGRFLFDGFNWLTLPASTRQTPTTLQLLPPDPSVAPSQRRSSIVQLGDAHLTPTVSPTGQTTAELRYTRGGGVEGLLVKLGPPDREAIARANGVINLPIACGACTQATAPLVQVIVTDEAGQQAVFYVPAGPGDPVDRVHPLDLTQSPNLNRSRLQELVILPLTGSGSLKLDGLLSARALAEHGIRLPPIPARVLDPVQGIPTGVQVPVEQVRVPPGDLIPVLGVGGVGDASVVEGSRSLFSPYRALELRATIGPGTPREVGLFLRLAPGQDFSSRDQFLFSVLDQHGLLPGPLTIQLRDRMGRAVEFSASLEGRNDVRVVALPLHQVRNLIDLTQLEVLTILLPPSPDRVIDFGPAELGKSPFLVAFGIERVPAQSTSRLTGSGLVDPLLRETVTIEPTTAAGAVGTPPPPPPSGPSPAAPAPPPPPPTTSPPREPPPPQPAQPPTPVAQPSPPARPLEAPRIGNVTIASADPVVPGDSLAVHVGGLNFGSTMGRLDVFDAPNHPIASFMASDTDQWDFTWSDTEIRVVVSPTYTQHYQPGNHRLGFQVTDAQGRPSLNAQGRPDPEWPTFTVGRATLPLPTTLTPNRTTVPEPVTLQWSPVPGAVSYALRARDDTDFTFNHDPHRRYPGGNNCLNNPFFYLCVDDVRTTSFSLPVQAGHNYFWWVYAVSADRHYSPVAYAGFSVQSGVPVPTTIGAQRTAVLLVNFADDLQERGREEAPGPREPYTRQEVYNYLFSRDPDSVSTYFQEASYGKTWLTGDVFGWYTLPITRRCINQAQDRVAIRNAAISSIADPQADFRQYSRILIVIPRQECADVMAGCPQSRTFNWNGFGGSPAPIETPNGPVTASLAWINETDKPCIEAGMDKATCFKQLVTHELAHGFGVSHSRVRNSTLDFTCRLDDYGDPFDLMGALRTALPHFNASHKYSFRWLSEANFVRTVTQSGTYSILPLAIDARTLAISPREKIQAIQLVKERDPQGRPTSWYFLEYRQPIGFDASLRDTAAVRGVTIRVRNLYDTYLVDTTPGDNDWTNAPLGAGQTFTDPAAGLTIAIPQDGLTPERATVEIQLPSVTPRITIENVTHPRMPLRVGDVPRYMLTQAPPQAELRWSSSKNDTPTGEVETFYGHRTDANGSWSGDGHAWTETDIGAWRKQVRVGNTVASVEFTVTQTAEQRERLRLERETSPPPPRTTIDHFQVLSPATLTLPAGTSTATFAATVSNVEDRMEADLTYSCVEGLTVLTGPGPQPCGARYRVPVRGTALRDLLRSFPLTVRNERTAAGSASVTLTLDVYGTGGGDTKTVSLTVTPAPPAGPPDRRLTLTGSVRMASGLPVAGVRVTLQESLSGQALTEATTDLSGTYTLTYLATRSSYVVKPQHAGFGFEPLHREVEVRVVDPTRPTIEVSGFSAYSSAPTIRFFRAELPSGPIRAGDSIRLSWESANTTGCTAFGGWSGTKPPTGSVEVRPTVTTTYTLSCTNATGPSDTKVVRVEVALPPPPPPPLPPPMPAPTCSLTFQVLPGGLPWRSVQGPRDAVVSFTWSTTGDADGQIPFVCTNRGGAVINSGTLDRPFGTGTSQPGQSVDCTITAQNAAGATAPICSASFTVR
ncbi:MAG: carboxypeptidase regulatory-like domain-containing protein [Candidatus Omnitrophica bacterium]|nr:carboxypeptidase regulatory-like domain-containing protein [Candidatus Omnitrophota bacterium]